MQNLILQFLRSPTWRTHTIHSAEEAYIDLLACPEDERPTTAIALAERWHLSRPTASKLITEMQEKNFIDSQNHLITDVKTFDTDVKTFDTPPSRVVNDNINALSDDKAEREKGVRVREAEVEGPPKTRSNAFRRPAPEEVQTYLQQLGETSFDGHEFCDYYEQCGWVIGRDRKPMKDWRAAVRTWRRNRSKQSPPLKLFSSCPIHKPSLPSFKSRSRAPAASTSLRPAHLQPHGRPHRRTHSRPRFLTKAPAAPPTPPPPVSGHTWTAPPPPQAAVLGCPPVSHRLAELSKPPRHRSQRFRR